MNGSQVLEKDLQRCRHVKEAEKLQLQVSCFCLLQFLVCPCEFIEVYFYYYYYSFPVILMEATFMGEDLNSLRKGSLGA